MRIIEYILSIILPKNRLTQKIEAMNTEDILMHIEKAGTTSDTHLKALFRYRHPLMRQAIWEIKYRRNRIIAEKFSRLLYEFIIEEITNEMAFSNFTSPLLVPVPAGKNSLRERGFNQCELLAEAIKDIDTNHVFDYVSEGVKKIRETTHQSKTENRAARLKNLSGAFLADSEKVLGRNIILIDDVITTGTTMKEISKALRNAGARKVIGFAIAH